MMRKRTAFLSFMYATLALLTPACVSAPVPAQPTQNTSPSPTPVQTVPANELISMGYYTGSQASFEALQKYAQHINIVSVDVYTVNAQGEIEGSDPFGAAAFARSHNIQAYACINNYNDAPGVYDFDPQLAKAALLTYKDTLIPALVALAETGSYDGINIDLEGIAYSEDLTAVRTQYSTFVQQLAGALHEKGLKLILSLPAKSADDPANSWSYPFDLALLGQEADYLQLMTYDQHGSWSVPGPVSGADWVEQVLAFSSSQVSATKLLIGLPAYGYDWGPNGRTVDVSWVDLPSLLDKTDVESHFDEPSQSPWLSYTENGQAHQVWYENEASIRAKTALIERYGLGGLSMWALGKEDEGFWLAAQMPLQ